MIPVIYAIGWAVLMLTLAGCVFYWLPARQLRVVSDPPMWFHRPVMLVGIAFFARGLSWLLLYGQAPASDPLQPVDRVLYLVAAAGTTWLLCRIAADRGLPRWAVLFYALNPLAIWAWVNGWPVIFLTFLVVTAIYATREEGKGWLAPMLVGAAIVVNIAALLLLPMILTRKNRRWAWLAGLPPLFSVTDWTGGLPFDRSLGFAPFLQAAARIAGGDQDVFQTWFLADVLSPLSGIPPLMIFSVALFLLLMALTAVWVLARDDRPSVAALSWMWILVLFPGLGPQYLVLLAALLIFTPQRSWLAVLAGTGLWLTHGYDLWLPTGFWGVLVLGLIYDSVRLVKPNVRRHPTVKELDIVIPTLNEGENLGPMLTHLQAAVEALSTSNAGRLPPKVNILVVDAGSTDNTVKIAREMGATVMTADTAGRGNQFAQGIAAGKAELILMLHADTRMQPHALQKLYGELSANPRISWGILGHVYTRRNFRMRLIELTNRLRFHLTGIAFGDQGIFLRRDVLTAIGGMPPLELMEDIELSLRLVGYKCRLDCGASLVVSTRHWDRRTYSGYMRTVLTLCAVYLWSRAFGVPVQKLAKRLYDRYYHQPKASPEGDGRG